MGKSIFTLVGDEVPKKLAQGPFLMVPTQNVKMTRGRRDIRCYAGWEKTDPMPFCLPLHLTCKCKLSKTKPKPRRIRIYIGRENTSQKKHLLLLRLSRGSKIVDHKSLDGEEQSFCL